MLYLDLNISDFIFFVNLYRDSDYRVCLDEYFSYIVLCVVKNLSQGQLQLAPVIELFPTWLGLHECLSEQPFITGVNKVLNSAQFKSVNFFKKSLQLFLIGIFTFWQR